MTDERRMELLNSAFMAEWLDGYCFGEEDEEYNFSLVVITGLDQQYVAVVNSNTHIDRLWVNSDGTVWAASGSDDPFLPQPDWNHDKVGGQWYCGDEIEQVGENFKFQYGSHEWSITMCIPQVETFDITPSSYAFLTTKWYLQYPDKRNA